MIENKQMKRIQEVEQRVAELERCEFMIQMSDYLNEQDKKELSNIYQEIQKLKSELEKLKE